MSISIYNTIQYIMWKFANNIRYSRSVVHKRKVRISKCGVKKRWKM